MNPDLKIWLETARTNLAPRAREIVRDQISEHFAAATERYQLEGKPLLKAEALAVLDLGDAREAAKKFEQAYLTNKELEKYQIRFAKTKNTSAVLPLIILSLGLMQFYFYSNGVKTALVFASCSFSFSLWHLARFSAARALTLRRFVLLDIIFGVTLVPLNVFFVYQTYQLPLLKQYSVYIGVAFSLMFFGLLLVLPKQISSWRKLSSL